MSISNTRDAFATVIQAPAHHPYSVRDAVRRHGGQVAPRRRADGGYSVTDAATSEKITAVDRIVRLVGDLSLPKCLSRPQIDFEAYPSGTGSLLTVRGTSDIDGIVRALQSVRVAARFAEFGVGADGHPACRFFVAYQGGALSFPMRNLVTVKVLESVQTRMR